ncbi:MAG: CofH family radical SAM protein [Thaumarchaeota archaeon]|nr:CofH family radical SAM protein [Nitrososphaerota archaeon]MCY3975770.1 CofH family radical SAM protein [Nitrososphaerota archaeon]
MDNKIFNDGPIKDVLEKILIGEDPVFGDCIKLFDSENIHIIGTAANYISRRRFGNKISYVNNIILNYTNVCITDCKFCAFYRPPGHEESYILNIDQIESRIKTSCDMFKIRQVLIQGGHSPSLGIEYYEKIFKMIRSKFPDVGIHGLSASEIDMISRIEKSSTKEVLSRLKASGLQSLTGAGAEILVDNVKNIISPKKISSDDWLKIMFEAHSIGLPSSATMMYGHVESIKDIINHFFKIVELQRKTHGFIAFIPWSFESNNTILQNKNYVKELVGGVSILKTIALSRLIFDGLINNIQSSWLTNGVNMAQLAILYGANDFGGTLIGEEVVSCTGARSTELTSTKIINSIQQIGYDVFERDNLYNPIRFC